MSVRIIVGDALAELRNLPDESVQMCCTSPPYYGLRDYGTAQWEGGDPACDHVVGEIRIGLGMAALGAKYRGGGVKASEPKPMTAKAECPHCGAVRADRQIGLEPSPDQYVAALVAVFREVRRVLRPDGVMFLNVGDSYASGGRATYRSGASDNKGQLVQNDLPRPLDAAGIKPKDLLGIPWMLAFALRNDGWVLRQEIVWQKPNPMPESVRDRCTKAHEQIFMFAKARWSGETPGRYAHVSEQDARWLALFLDTEGNITVKRASGTGGRTNYGAQLCFAGTHRGLIDRAQSIIGDGVVLERPGLNAPMFYLQMSNNRAADLLRAVYPHLIVKQRQARLCIHLQDVIAAAGHERRTKAGRLRGRLRSDEYTDELERLWLTNKQLNKFGNPDVAWVPEPKFGRWADCEPYYYDAEAIKEDSITEDARRPYTSEGAWALDGRPAEQRHGGEIRSAYRQPNSPQSIKSPHGQGFTRRALGDRGEQAPAEVRSSSGARMGRGAGWRDDPSTTPFTRNKRSVWTVATAPYSEAHFATFPPALIEPCILAGCPEGGTVLDPFAGAGTTGLVADRLGRNAILIELNESYATMAKRRIEGDAGLFAAVDLATAPTEPRIIEDG